MAHKLYDTPNHPRWDAPANQPRTEPTTSRWERERLRSQRRSHPTEEENSVRAPPLVSREGAADDATVELSNSPNRVRITAELPDISLDDVRISTDGRSLRIRAPSPESSTGTNGIDRTIAFTEPLDSGNVVVTYRDPALTVVLPKTVR